VITEKEGMMSFFTVVVLAAALATVVALISGISTMASDGEVGHTDSGHWMQRRVAFQAIAFLLILLAIYLTH
jgi:Hypoxia induced protein conserved region